MPAILAALMAVVNVIKVGTGIVSVAAGTVILGACFLAYSGAFIAARLALYGLFKQLPHRYLMYAFNLGILDAVPFAFALLAGAIAIRYTRFLAARAVLALKALAGGNS